MSQTPWDVLASAITRLNDKFAAQPEVREATVVATSPLSILFDTDLSPTLVHRTLDGSVQPGERVFTMKLRHYVWIVGSVATTHKVTDWDQAIKPGFYWSESSALNNPTGGGALGYVLHNPGPSPRVWQEIFSPGNADFSRRQSWRRVLDQTTNIWTAFTRVGQVPNYAKTPSAIANGGVGTFQQNDGNVSFGAANTLRLTEVFLGEGDVSGNTDTAFEFILNIKNSGPSAAASTHFLGLAGGTTARSTLRSSFMQIGGGSGTVTVGGETAAVQNPRIMSAVTLQITGMVVHGFVHHALSSSERTKIDYTISADNSGGQYISGMVYNESISVDDGLRFGATATDRIIDGNIFIKRIN